MDAGCGGEISSNMELAAVQPVNCPFFASNSHVVEICSR